MLTFARPDAGCLDLLSACCRQPPRSRRPLPRQRRRPRPTARTFASDGGMVLNFIKPDKTADFEAVIAKLKEALAEEREA